MFLDETEISVRSGKGGDGAATFRREKYIPRGGPNGGDGGKGGDVVVVADLSLRTLIDFRYRPRYHADDGKPGGSNEKSGRHGEDIEIKVPVGTVIHGEQGPVADLTAPGQRVVLAKGGRGGRGNVHFKSPTRQAPHFAEKGEPGEERKLRLELKLLADVGVIGLPNVGKSTLISKLSSAKPKIANYPFTTLVPNLGVVKIQEGTSYVIADMPGLIEGASKGAGMGHAFLRHIERTRLLIHVLDLSLDRNPLEDLELVNRELFLHNPRLSELTQLIAANKMDLPEAQLALEEYGDALRQHGPVFAISAATGEGVWDLAKHAATLLPEAVPVVSTDVVVARQEPAPLHVEKLEEGLYRVTGTEVERLIAQTDLDNEEGVRYLQDSLRRIGVFRALEAQGASEGDKVIIREAVLNFVE